MEGKKKHKSRTIQNKSCNRYTTTDFLMFSFGTYTALSHAVYGYSFLSRFVRNGFPAKQKCEWNRNDLWFTRNDCLYTYKTHTYVGKLHSQNFFSFENQPHDNRVTKVRSRLPQTARNSNQKTASKWKNGIARNSPYWYIENCFRGRTLLFISSLCFLSSISSAKQIYYNNIHIYR